MADFSTVEDIEWLNDSAPELFTELVRVRPDIAYRETFWTSDFSLIDKIDLFRRLFENDRVGKGQLLETVFSSKNGELLARIAGDLSAKELPLVLDWLDESRDAGSRPEWIAFARGHISEVVKWINSREKAGRSTVILAANVLDSPPPLHTVLSSDVIMMLAEAVQPIAAERHEVAAFVYVTTAWLKEPKAGDFCFTAFAELHRAIAESRLGDRAWHILSKVLLPLPIDEWDSCEKLRRATLHFACTNQWSFDALWRIARSNESLYYDFIRTARAFEEGRTFFRFVYEASARGTIVLDKKRSKEIKKVLKS